MIRATIEHIEGRYFASATDEATPWLRITACPHLHKSVRSALRCIEPTRRRAERIVLLHVARDYKEGSRS